MRLSRVKNLLGLMSLLVVSSFLAGCAEEGDVLLKPSSTMFSLEISKLPTAPPGMIYELWVCTRAAIDTSAPSNLIKPLMRFNYLTGSAGPFLADTAGNPISTNQTLGVDIFDYSSVFVSIEPS